MRTDYGIGWTLAGLELSGTDEDGVQWLVRDVLGWDNPAAVTGGVVSRPDADGGYLEPSHYEPASLVLQHRIIADSTEAALRAMNALKRAIPARSLAPMVQLENGVLKHRMVKQEGKPSFTRSENVVDASIQFVSPDYRVLSGDGSAEFSYSERVGLPQTTGGLQVGSLQLPFKVAADTNFGSVVIRNQGDATPPVKVLFTDVVNPSVTSSDGRRQDFNIAVGSGQTLEVDLDSRTVKLNGVNRRNIMQGSWIEPADGTALKFNASTYNANALMTVRWSDAWR